MKFHWAKHLKVTKWRLSWQIVCAMIYVIITLVVLDILSESPLVWAVGSSSLASSAYLVFASPCSSNSKSTHIVGAYFVAILCGLVVRHISAFVFTHTGTILFGLTHDPHMYWLSGTLALGLSMYLMLSLGWGHPPAAGMALILVIDQRSYQAVIAIFLLALLLGVFKWIFGSRLCDVV